MLPPLRTDSRETGFATRTAPQRRPAAASRKRRLGIACGALLALSAALTCATETSLDAIQKSASEWVKIRVETVRVEKDWASEKGLLESTIRGLEERAQVLEETRENAQAKGAKESEELDSIRAKIKQANEELSVTETRLKTVTQQLVAMRAALPPRLSEALELPYRSLSNAGATTGERMQYVTTVLNRCLQFNRTVTCGEDVLTLDSATGAKAYEVIYWGLSHGYALDRSTKRAWLGSPGASGWQWEPLPDGAKAVADLIAIHGDKADPALVSAPARIAHVSGANLKQ